MDFAQTKQGAFRARLIQVLGAMADQYPECAVEVELWRPRILNEDGYPDEQTEVWVRLGEDVPGFRVEQGERWFQEGIGVINQVHHLLILPDGFGLRPDDHVVIEGDAWLIIEATEMCGVEKLKLDRVKSRFARPARAEPVYREVGMKARIA